MPCRFSPTLLVCVLVVSIGVVQGFVTRPPVFDSRSTRCRFTLGRNEMQMISNMAIPRKQAHVNGAGAMDHLTVDGDAEVFCNREINMQQIRAVGFDMDYTLAQYNIDFELLAYDGAKQKLVDTFGYPVRKCIILL